MEIVITYRWWMVPLTLFFFALWLAATDKSAHYGPGDRGMIAFILLPVSIAMFVGHFL